jgi:hypothetical protein
MLNNFHLPVFIKHRVVGWFSSVRQLFCVHVVVEKSCILCSKDGFGLSEFKNPPPCPSKTWSNKVTPVWYNSIRKYTIENPDEYDLEFGIGVEIGVFTVEDYYYTKGWTVRQNWIDKGYLNT